MTEPNLPLGGFRIIDLTTAWAGPMAGRILAQLGAEVIHIESSGRLDSWRSHGGALYSRRYPDEIPGPHGYNRAALFNSQNLDKLSLTLDLKTEAGKSVFRDLVARSDGLLSNFTPGMLARLGFGNEVLWQLRPDLVILEMPAYGNSGPMQSWAALGPTMEQVAGMCAMVGYGDGRPVSTGPAYLDPIGAFHGAAAMLTALLHRQRSGEGQHVEVPQVEAAMHAIGEYIIHAAETGRDQAADGNRRPGIAPHDVFPARGGDEWVVIEAADETQWRALCRAIGNPALADDPRFATMADRVRNQPALAEPIAAWTRTRDKHAAARILQDAGVPAAPVYKANDTIACDYLNFRGFSQPIAHPQAGTHPHQGLPFRFARTPVAHRRAAPMLGEHSRYVLRDVLGRSEADIAALEQDGTLRAVPDA
jgi:crotonobetainyl-CoA:carnitine CoA-transferase CaiB-like acyl-CoA transferase